MPAKTDRSQRQVLLGPLATNVLATAIADVAPGELAFDIQPDYVSASMPAACERSGVKQVRFHDLRHTHASLLLAQTSDILGVSKRLGHATSGFTLTVYGHVMPGRDGELAMAMDDLEGSE